MLQLAETPELELALMPVGAETASGKNTKAFDPHLWANACPDKNTRQGSRLAAIGMRWARERAKAAESLKENDASEGQLASGSRFTGKEEDAEVGLQYFGKRFLNAQLNRWASPDPLGVHAASADLNLYAYVHGRILRNIDPLGLQPRDAGAPDADAGAPATPEQRGPDPQFDLYRDYFLIQANRALAESAPESSVITVNPGPSNVSGLHGQYNVVATQSVATGFQDELEQTTVLIGGAGTGEGGPVVAMPLIPRLQLDEPMMSIPEDVATSPGGRSVGPTAMRPRMESFFELGVSGSLMLIGGGRFDVVRRSNLTEGTGTVGATARTQFGPAADAGFSFGFTVGQTSTSYPDPRTYRLHILVGEVAITTRRPAGGIEVGNLMNETTSIGVSIGVGPGAGLGISKDSPQSVGGELPALRTHF